MPVKVLIVDDSGFFRHRISDLLSGDSRIEVVGTAKNGKEAIEQAKSLRPNLITMDVEMPQMNGIEAVRVIMRECPTNILMLSSLTSEATAICRFFFSNVSGIDTLKTSFAVSFPLPRSFRRHCICAGIEESITSEQVEMFTLPPAVESMLISLAEISLFIDI